MKTAAAILSFLAATAVAAPLNLNKRKIVWVTATAEVVETVYTTTTVWVDTLPTVSAAGGEFYNVASSSAVPTSTVAVAPTSSVIVAAVPSSTSVYVPPPVSSQVAPTTSTYVAPTSVYTPPAAPTSTYVAPVVQTTTSAAPAATSAAAGQFAQQSSGSSSSSSGSSSGTTYTGEITHYDVGQGSCGWTNTADEAVVAVAHGMMNNGANPNNNPWCGKSITIEYNGSKHTAKIVDTCPGCSGADLDLSDSLFTAVAPNGDGRVTGVKWYFNGN